MTFRSELRSRHEQLAHQDFSMKKLTSSRPSISLLAIGFAAALAGCSAPRGIGLRDSLPVAAPVEPAGFRLSGATVKWVDDANVPTNFTYGTNKYSPQPPTEGQTN